MLGEFERFGRVDEGLVKSVEERVAIGEVEVGLGQWKQLLFCHWVLGGLECLLKILNAQVHIGGHIGMLRQII